MKRGPWRSRPDPGSLGWRVEEHPEPVEVE